MVATDSMDVLERGDAAPAFDLPAAEGGRRALGDFSDREALLVVFTCNHCPYAKAKIEELNALAESYEGLAVVGINPNDPEQYPEDSFDRMEELVAEGTVRYDAYLFDEDQAVAAAYGATCTPDPFLFERAGEGFRLAYHGRIDDALNPEAEPTDREMKKLVDRLLAGEEIEEAFRPSRGCSIKWRPGNEPDYWD